MRLLEQLPLLKTDDGIPRLLDIPAFGGSFSSNLADTGDNCVNNGRLVGRP